MKDSKPRTRDADADLSDIRDRLEELKTNGMLTDLRSQLDHNRERGKNIGQSSRKPSLDWYDRH